MKSTIIDMDIAEHLVALVAEYEGGHTSPVELCMLVSQQICIWENERRKQEGDGFA